MMTRAAIDTGASHPRRAGAFLPDRARVEPAGLVVFLVRAGVRETGARGFSALRLFAVAPCRDVVLDAMSPEVLCEGQRYRMRIGRFRCE